MMAPSNRDTDAERRRIGERLRQAREYLGLSQDEVARHLAVTRTAITGIETGQRRVEALELKKLSELYKQPSSYFSGEDEFASALPVDVAHLARKAAKLSSKDREELGRFAEYLRARSATDGENG
ncbi:transcriptional regulator with XRE-family HTH domain [Bradyrhizobium sp. RT6a]